MIKKFGQILALVIVVFVFSCDNPDSFKSSDKGFEYKLIETSDVESNISNDDFLEIDVKYYSESDSLLFDSQEFPEKFRIQVVDASLGGILQDAIKMLNIGDSAHFLIPCTDFFDNTAKSGIPPFMSLEEKLRFEIRIIGLTSQDEIKNEREQYFKEKEAEEQVALSEYLSVEGITSTPNESGLYILQLERGKGKKAKVGQTAVVHYKGTLLDGTQFDSSIDRDEPYEFKIGNGEVIKAWDEAVATMRIGDKIKIIAPSYLAYGRRGSGRQIPPYSALIFEIKLLDIKK